MSEELAEQRHKLEFFINDRDPNDNVEDIVPFFIEKDKVLLAGREIFVNDCRLVYYIFPIDEFSAFLMLYIGDDAFDDFCENLDEHNQEAAYETWPKLMKAIFNGIHDNFTEIALTKIDIPNFKFWGTFVKIENIRYDDLDCEYIQRKASNLINNTIEMLQEYMENDLSNWQKVKIVAKAGIEGFLTAKRFLNIASLFMNR